MGRSFSMSSAWAKQEREAEKLRREEGLFTGHEDKQRRIVRRQSVFPHLDGQAVDLGPPDVSLGLDTDLMHVGGKRFSVLKYEAERGGDVNAYIQVEGERHTRKIVGKKTEDGRHYFERPRKTFSF